MHRCSGGLCSCGGLFHTQTNTPFAVMFPSHYDSHDHVDCTLSLGTPSTRLSDENTSTPASCMSSFCWDMFQTKNTTTTSYAPNNHYSRGNHAQSTTTTTSDPLVARRCANCGTTSTPLWRNGPRGPKSLCNACGIRYKKEERRATTAAANSGSNTNGNNQNTSNGWGVIHQTQKTTLSRHEFRFVQEDADSNSIPNFLSWRLNVADRPGLVHDFTR